MKVTFNIEQLRVDLITKRVINNCISLGEASKEIGVSKSTLSRLENKRPIDIDSFTKICGWLNKYPQEYFKVVLESNNVELIKDTTLSARAKGNLHAAGYMYVREMKDLNMDLVAKWRNCGQTTVKEIREFIENLPK